MATIFISHSSKDNALAIKLQQALDAAGFASTFLDIDEGDGLVAGEGWNQALYQRLHQCNAVIALVTDNWRQSRWCFAEVVLATEKGKAILPARADDGPLPSILSDYQAVDLTDDWDQAMRRLTTGLRDIGVDADGIATPDPSIPPYPGMVPFNEDGAAYFFGRDDEIDDLRETLDSLGRQAAGAPRLVLVLGASGSGKSSLVRAGLLPRLRNASKQWFVVNPMRPLGDPFGELAGAIRSAGIQAGLDDRGVPADGLLQGPIPERAAALVQVTDQLRRTAGGDATTTLLVLDQTEELLVPSAGPSGADFLTALGQALTLAGPRLMVVATMRSDFLGAFQSHPAVRLGAESGLAYRPFPVQQMPVSLFAEVITKPANRAGLTLEPGLAERLIADAEGPDAMPILAFTLRKLWREFGRHSGEITIEDYGQIDGLQGSVRGEAQRILKDLNPSDVEQSALRASFVTHLAEVGHDGVFIRRNALKDDLPADSARLVQAFVDAGLMVTSPDRADRETIEISHEALLRVWPLLTGWLQEDRADAQQLSSMRRAAMDWDQAGRSVDALIHRDGRLAAMIELTTQDRFRLPDGSVDAAYLEACQNRQTERERLVRMARLKSYARAAIVVLAVGIGGWFGYQELVKSRADADAARIEAEATRTRELISETRRLASLSESQRIAGDDSTAIRLARLAIQGWDPSLGPEPIEANAAMIRAMDPYRAAKTVIDLPADMALELFDDGKKLLGAGERTLWIADANTGEVLHQAKYGGRYGVILSPDGRTALAGGNGGIWDLSDLSVVQARSLDGARISSVHSAAISPDSKTAFFGDEAGRIVTIDLLQADRRVIESLPPPDGTGGYLHKLMISPDGTRIAAIRRKHLTIHKVVGGHSVVPVPLMTIELDAPEEFHARGPGLAFFVADTPLLLLAGPDHSSSQLLIDTARAVQLNVAGPKLTRGEWLVLFANGKIPSLPLPDLSLPRTLRNLAKKAREVLQILHDAERLPDGVPRFLDDLTYSGEIELRPDAPFVFAGKAPDQLHLYGMGKTTWFRHHQAEQIRIADGGSSVLTGSNERAVIWGTARLRHETRRQFSSDDPCSEQIIAAYCGASGARIVTMPWPKRGDTEPQDVCAWRHDQPKPTSRHKYKTEHGLFTPSGVFTADGSKMMFMEHFGMSSGLISNSIAMVSTDTDGWTAKDDPKFADLFAEVSLSKQVLGLLPMSLSGLSPSDDKLAALEFGNVTTSGTSLVFQDLPPEANVQRKAYQIAGLRRGLDYDAKNRRALTHTENEAQLWNAQTGRLVDLIPTKGSKCLGFDENAGLQTISNRGSLFRWDPGVSPIDQLLILSDKIAPGPLTSQQRVAFNIQAANGR